MLNCWEFKKCGRQPGGSKVVELGVCPAAVESRTTGMNRGTNGGRTCWAIAGTFCGGKVQGTFASKAEACTRCEFFALVSDEEKRNFVPTRTILATLK